MRICLVSEFFLPLLGGIQEHLSQFSSHCIKLGHEVTLLTSNTGSIDSGPIPKGLKVHRIGRSVPIFSNGSFARATLAFRLGKRIREFFLKNTFDIIHVHPPIVPTLPALAVRYKTAPMIGTVHTYFEKNFGYWIFQKQGQMALNSHDGFIAVSSCCIDAMRKYFNFDAEVIPNGVDPVYFASGKPLPHLKDDKFNILFLGRLDPRNGLETLLRSFSILKKRKVNARLIIAGDGPFRPHFEKSVEAQCKQDVHFVGQIYQERPDYLASADVLCYPAQLASFGITLLEAMAAGLPVVASDINGFKDLVRPGKEGLLASPGQADSFADAFEQLADDKNLCINLGEQGRKRADEFSWDKVSERILSFYDKTLGNHKGGYA